MNASDTDCEILFSDLEPLYLLKDENNVVYVNNSLLEQHQIDGLRFLFKQFNKKSPGVIVNFPPSCGKSATIALFLNAVSKILKNPVLLLCKDDRELQCWKEILLKWSPYVDSDIAVESLNPFIKGKKVFLKKRENLSSYLRRKWSIIIVKENAVNKDMFKLSFESDFKICVTATDIKKDVSLLSTVFNWLYPKPKVNVTDFVAKENSSTKEKYRKSVQLDLILEDVAIRRYFNLKPFQTTKMTPDSVQEFETKMTDNETIRRKRPLKNKDTTGTKSKRLEKITKEDIILNTTSDQIANNQKQLIEALDLNNDCQEFKATGNETVTDKINECKKSDGTLMSSESTESSSFDRDSDGQNKVSHLNKNIDKRESTESLKFDRNSDIDQNKMKDLHNKNVSQKQLVESLGLEIKDEESDFEQHLSIHENKRNVVPQIASNVNDDEIIMVKGKSEDVNETNTGRNVNIVSDKRKSDVSDKDLDYKISEMEEKALKKFKGSILDSIF